METYTTARQGYQINKELLYFYTLRRRVEDVAVDIQRLTEESPNEAESEELLNWIKIGVDKIQELLKLSEQLTDYSHRPRLYTLLTKGKL